jgi:hypothetical protein
MATLLNRLVEYKKIMEINQALKEIKSTYRKQILIYGNKITMYYIYGIIPLANPTRQKEAYND